MQRKFLSGGGVSPRNTRRLRGQSTIEYVLIIAIIVLVILIVGPWVSSAIRNQFNLVAGTIGSGTTGENFYEPVDIPDPENGTAFAVYSADDDSLMFYKRRGTPKIGDMFNDRRVTALYENFEETTLPSSGDSKYEAGAWHEYKQSVKTVSVVDEGIRPKSVAKWFGNFTAMQSFDINRLDMSICTDAHYLFVFCRNLQTADLSGWQTPALTNIGGMFEQCNSLKAVNLNGWRAPKVDACWYLFWGNSLKTVDLSDTTFGKIKDAEAMFGYNFQLESIDFGVECDFSAAYDLTKMFEQCQRLNLDCSGWDISPDTLHSGFNKNAPSVILPKSWQ